MPEEMKPKTQEDLLKTLQKVDDMVKRRGRVVVAPDPEYVPPRTAGRGRTEEPLARETTLVKHEERLNKYLNALGGGVVAGGFNVRPVVAKGFEVNPTNPSTYDGLYIPKLRGIPNMILKRLAVQAELPAACCLVRSNQFASFGVPRRDRFSKGYVFEPKVGVVDKFEAKEKAELDARIERAVRRMERCGAEEERLENVPLYQQRQIRTFSEFLHESVRDAIVVGQAATERVFSGGGETGIPKRFEFFLPRDAGTMYKSCSTQERGDSYRKQGLNLIAKLNKLRAREVIDPNRWEHDEYAFWQVIDGLPQMVFTDEEMAVINFYPVSDVEWQGYPVTPLDIVISAVTTHLHITTHNRLYFQNGRAARGMIVITSDDVSEDVVANVRQQFNAVINGSQNAYRMPVFGLMKEDEISWVPIEQQGGRDMEFQYLSDANIRSILTAFQMSPEELTAYGYLSRGTNSQALSEGSNEWKLEAARDLGIRPLLAKFEDLINREILPYLDPGLEKLVTFRFMGLDAETPEKESTRLQEDMAVHMTMDEVLQHVEKTPVGKDLGGEVLLNPAWMAIVEKYRTAGYILERLFGVEGAASKPELMFVQNPFWFQHRQMLLEEAQLQAQQQQATAAAQPGQAPAPGQEGHDPGGDPGAQPGNADPQADPQQTERQRTEGAQDSSASGHADKVGAAASGAAAALGKGERHLTHADHQMLSHHAKVVNHAMRGWDNDAQQARDELLASVDELLRG